MDKKLTWGDLFLQDSQLEFQQIFSCWPQITGNVLPIGLSAFGDAFFARPDDSVWRLDSFTGKLRQVAKSQSEFAEHMNSKEWQEEELRSLLVFELHKRGLVRGPRQVFALIPHPAMSENLRLDLCQVMDAVVWHSVSSQVLSQVGGRPVSEKAQSMAVKPRWKFW